MALVRTKPTVQDLTLKKTTIKRNDDFWEIIATEWICPRSLAIEYSVKEPKHSNAFWRACSRFKTLHHQQRQSLFLSAVPTATSGSYGGGAPLHMEWIRRCPRLVHLDWNLIGLWSPVERLVIELNNKTWPNLSSFRLERSIHSDKESSSLIASLPHLKFLELS
ncbi:hypothetical protein BGX24_010059 [Mortierella sp. AD032]|nr:hypothetical protein BGX24_010059 [Mortierella sp. AD032]